MLKTVLSCYCSRARRCAPLFSCPTAIGQADAALRHIIFIVSRGPRNGGLSFMKILMFGWEFPPHISGGLGTACYGLTHALLKTGTEVLFVVPVVRDSESEREDFLINASAVLNPQVSVGEPPQYAEVEHKSTRRSKLKEAREQVTVIQVPAQIVPYHHQWTEADRVVELTSWNYSFPSSTEQVIHSKTSTTKRSESNSQQAKPKRFVFSGKYGPDLMTEVERYADVADVIAEKYSFDAIHVH